MGSRGWGVVGCVASELEGEEGMVVGGMQGWKRRIEVELWVRRWPRRWWVDVLLLGEVLVGGWMGRGLV